MHNNNSCSYGHKENIDAIDCSIRLSVCNPEANPEIVLVVAVVRNLKTKVERTTKGTRNKFQNWVEEG